MCLISFCNFLVLETHVFVNDWIVQMHTILTSVFAWVYSMGNKISFIFLGLSNLGNPIRKELKICTGDGARKWLQFYRIETPSCMYRSTCFNYVSCCLFWTCFLSIGCKSSGPSISFHGFNCGTGTKFPDQMKGTEQLNSHDMLLSNEETFRFEHVTVAGDVGRSILTSLSSLSLQYRHIGNGQLSHSQECESPFCCTLRFSDI